MANRPDGTCHDTCPYSTLQHKHILVGHAAWDDTHVCRARLRIFGTQTLKSTARHEHILVGHAAQDSTHVSSAQLRILGTRVLKA